MDIPIYEMLIDSTNDDETGVNLVSFVSYPAIERDFVALSEPEKQYHKLNHDKQIVTGPALIPGQDILRISADGTPYFIRFSRETIEQIRDKYHRLKKTDLTNDEHETPLQGNFLVESWIIEEPTKDKAAALGLSDLPAGTWVLSFKIPDSKYWAEAIKSGIRAGFSIEGVFNLDEINTQVNNNKMTVAEKFYNVVKEFFSKNNDPNTELAEETPTPETETAADETPAELGTNGGNWLSARIDEMVDETQTRGDVIDRVAQAAGVEASTIEQIISGEIQCPPIERLQAFADVMGVQLETVIEQFMQDACEYEMPEMANEIPAAEQPATDWEDLEKAIADVKAMEAEHAAALSAKDALIAELQKTVKEQTEKIEQLSAEPATAPVDMSKTTAPAKKSQAERMADAWARIKAQKNGN